MINSNIVASNFSRKSSSYNIEAIFQKDIAKKFFKFSSTHSNRKNNLNILELGCGTGFLTIPFLQKYSNSNFLLSDIAPGMIKENKKTTSNLRSMQNVNYEICDISKNLPSGHFDFIYSGLTFQWVSELDTLFEKINLALNDKGSFQFSMITKNTFTDLQKSFKLCNIEYSGPKMVSTQYVIDILSKFKNLKHQIVTYNEKYSSVMQFLKRIQQTGAGNPNKTHLSPKSLKKILKTYQNNFAESNGDIIVQYEVLFISAQK